METDGNDTSLICHHGAWLDSVYEMSWKQRPRTSTLTHKDCRRQTESRLFRNLLGFFCCCCFSTYSYLGSISESNEVLSFHWFNLPFFALLVFLWFCEHAKSLKTSIQKQLWSQYLRLPLLPEKEGKSRFYSLGLYYPYLAFRTPRALKLRRWLED